MQINLGINHASRRSLGNNKLFLTLIHRIFQMLHAGTASTVRDRLDKSQSPFLKAVNLTLLYLYHNLQDPVTRTSWDYGNLIAARMWIACLVEIYYLTHTIKALANWIRVCTESKIYDKGQKWLPARNDSKATNLLGQSRELGMGMIQRSKYNIN